MLSTFGFVALQNPHPQSNAALAEDRRGWAVLAIRSTWRTHDLDGDARVEVGGLGADGVLVERRPLLEQRHPDRAVVRGGHIPGPDPEATRVDDRRDPAGPS